MSRFLLLTIVTFTAVSPLDAQPGNPPGSSPPGIPGPTDEGGLNTAYELTVVLHLQEHPLLTPHYVQKLERSLRDNLQNELGPTATVEVVRRHPLMEEVFKSGWTVLDRPHLIDGRKVHLLRLEFADGRYDLQARQVDGSSGLVSPLRRARTADPVWVARQAALMVGQDFGPVATVGAARADGRFPLKLQAGKLGRPTAMQVEPGDVFALAQIRRSGDGRWVGHPIPDTLLHVRDPLREGECTANLFSRYLNPIQKDEAIIGYRALKLRTRHGPLQLRVVDGKTGDPIPAVEVLASQLGTGDSVQPVGTTDANGRVRSREGFRSAVLMQLAVGGRVRARLPIPLIEEGTIEFRLGGAEETEKLAEFEYRFQEWRRRADDVAASTARGTRAMEDLDRSGQRPAAIQKAKELAAALGKELQPLRTALAKLDEETKTAGREAEVLIAEGKQRLLTLDDQARSLQEFARRRENPTKAEAAFDRGVAFEQNAEIAEAIRAYEESLTENPDQAPVRTRIERLKQALVVKSDKHKAGRDFIYQTWAKLALSADPNLDQAEKRLAETDAALKECVEAGDTFAVRRLYKVNVTFLDRLGAVAARLSPQDSDEDKQKAQAIVRIGEGVLSLNRKASGFLERGVR